MGWWACMWMGVVFFFQAEDGIRDDLVTGVQTCALPISQKPLKIPDTTKKGAFASLRRLTPFVKPYRAQMVLMTLSALGATLVGVAVPLVTRQLIDGPIAHHDKGALWPLGGRGPPFGVAGCRPCG